MEPPLTQATTAEKHICSSCDREYTSRGALARHFRAHQSNNRYTCNVCQLRFHRRDILVRHAQIHIADAEGDDPNSGRRRCVQACDLCRQAKVKCSGGDPCHRCHHTLRTCTYEHQSTRLNRKQALPEPEAFSSQGPPLKATAYNSIESPIHGKFSKSMFLDMNELRDAGRADSGTSYPSYSEISSSPLVSDPATLEPQNASGVQESAIVALDEAWLTSIDPVGSVSWPALHDEISLQDPWALDANNFSFPALRNNVDPSLNNNESLGFPQPSGSEMTNGASELDVQISWQFMNSNPSAPSGGDVLSPMVLPSNLDQAQSNLRYLSTIDPTNQGMRSREQVFMLEKLVCEAAADLSKDLKGDPVARSRKREQAAGDIKAAFGLDDLPSEDVASPHVLHYFVKLYFDHFHGLWPILWHQGFDYDTVEPLLYLTMASIGAMYAKERAAAFGSIMHQCLRSTLMTAWVQCARDEDKMESIFAALLLTQVMALYFGQPQAFSIAQQLSGVLVSQGRKANLFYPIKNRLNESHSGEHLSDKSLASWIRSERRRRLVFGFFRSEVFLSALLNTRPLFSFEEVNFEMPCDDALWIYVGHGWRRKIISAIEKQNERRLTFSDLVRVALEPAESFPHLPTHHNMLILFGLQLPFWNFAHDPDLLSRLTGHTDDMTNGQLFETGIPQNENKSMNFLIQERSRILQALEKWKLAACEQMETPSIDWNYRFSSLALYHIDMVRLNCPLDLLHLVSYRTRVPDTTERQDKSDISKVQAWIQSPASANALWHASVIYSLTAHAVDLAKTILRPTSFNIMTFIALHHAAVVVWACAGACQIPPASYAIDQSPNDPFPLTDEQVLAVFHEQPDRLLAAFVNLFRAISPAWKTASSFGSTAEWLAEHPFQPFG